MVKCFALFGLGHYIYSGEDLPAPEKAQAKPAPAKPAAKKPAQKKNKPDPNHDHVYGEELIKSIKATANRLDKNGWEPDDQFKRRIKAALSRGEVDMLLEVKAELEALEGPAEQLSTPF
jgi:hypothetical protein